MPTYLVRWTEEHEAIVTAKDEAEAIYLAEQIWNEHSYEAELMEDDPE